MLVWDTPDSTCSVFIRHCSPEVPEPTSERAPNLGQTLRTEHKQRDHKYEQQVGWLKDVANHSGETVAEPRCRSNALMARHANSAVQYAHARVFPTGGGLGVGRWRDGGLVKVDRAGAGASGCVARGCGGAGVRGSGTGVVGIEEVGFAACPAVRSRAASATQETHQSPGGIPIVAFFFRSTQRTRPGSP